MTFIYVVKTPKHHVLQYCTSTKYLRVCLFCLWSISS